MSDYVSIPCVTGRALRRRGTAIRRRPARRFNPLCNGAGFATVIGGAALVPFGGFNPLCNGAGFATRFLR